MKVVWRKEASDDLEVIYEYIFKDSPQNAVMVFNKIHDLAETLVIFPEKHPVEPVFDDPDIRFLVIWNYKIIYTFDKKSIAILRVFDTRRNPKKLKP
ncbi:type II toxin-antitoxin system RelE/ParE family toxin [Flavobacterium album]|uniref:Type II toxin-antitoxin system RelE/ParE family toxin n=1 Tax=Flavobacterium album TaxID=2175091 RepID=A0A2S1QUV2_9FLAO|nr:type II toxin-antitoxin system RelE/ParE family toxin [Flavobacterium album]AWH84187.1 type II toxin-antitoxin system RelE/ParE family toxin [Flavobacterium album]